MNTLNEELWEHIEGVNPVTEALRAGRKARCLLVAQGRSGAAADAVRLAREAGVAVEQVSRERLDAMSKTRNHQGIILLAWPREYVQVGDLLARAAGRGEPPFLVMAAGVEDPQNLGSLLRSADAAGVHGVIIPERRAVGLTPATVRASAGASEYVPVARVTNLVNTVKELKAEGVWVYGAEAAGGTPYYRIDMTGPLLLVVGGEDRGIPRLLRETCDFLVSIPMRGGVSSLNAAVAGAVLLYEILRQRAAGADNG